MLIKFPHSPEPISGSKLYMRPTFSPDPRKLDTNEMVRHYHRLIEDQLISIIIDKIAIIDEKLTMDSVCTSSRKSYLEKINNLLHTFIENPDIIASRDDVITIVLLFIEERFDGVEVILNKNNSYCFIIDKDVVNASQLNILQFMLNQYRKDINLKSHMNLRDVITQLVYAD